jgi:hypothetical protein
VKRKGTSGEKEKVAEGGEYNQITLYAFMKIS